MSVVVLVVVSLLGADRFASRVRGADEVFSPRHVAELESVLSAVVSPDGTRIAYTLAVPRQPLKEANGAAWVRLHVTDAAGDSRPYVDGQENVSQIQWTPDGKAICFIAKRGGDKYNSLYRLPVDGGEARRIVAHSTNVSGAAFSPDGKRIAFLAQDPIDQQRQEYRDKGFDPEVYEQDWRATKVWIVDADGRRPARSLDLPGSASFVQWHPTANQLVVVLAPTPLVDDYYMFRRVRVVDVDAGRVIEKIDNPGKLGQVGWSPDGRYLALISGEDIHDPKDGRLMIAEVPGSGGVKDLMPEYQAHVNSFAWKDAQTLTWVADEGVLTTVGTVDVNGERNVIHGPARPVLSDLTLSSDGQTAAMVGHAPDHPGEVFVLDDGTPRRLTDSNEWLESMRFARQEVVRWTARDGLELEGILVYPLNYQEGRRYPMIMTVHGGPEAHVSDGWVTRYSYPGQVGAARGFVVFYPNYRGSTGRGVEFSRLGQKDAAGKEFDDLVDGIDHLVEAGLVSSDRVGITGGSYGGYASAWGATYYSDRFAASVMFVGISDNVSKVGTTDIPEEMFLVHHFKRLWDDWNYFLDRSPIRHVQKHQTPILILHGKNDPRVHPSQSLELYRHLKTLDQAPVRLILYPGEGHGNRLAAARLDYNIRMMRWMEHYLTRPGGSPPEIDIDYAKVLEH